MLCKGAAFVKKKIYFDTAGLHLLTFRILEPYPSNTVAYWDSMGRVVTQTRSRAFQTLDRVFQTLLIFSQGFKSSVECLKTSAERLKDSVVCFKTSTRPSVSLKRVYENLVFKKHRIIIGV